ncbi:MAG TPA: N-6 DNA methylase [Terriglobia bacterium]|nr:N-6 DNA methylase [Terriglobia bacterium]
MPSKFQQILRSIGKTCEGQSLTEAEVEKVVQGKGFFTELGYEGFGVDLLAQRSGRSQKRFDVALLGFGGRVRTIIEFKQVNAGPLAAFQQKLFDEYVRPQLALFGVLTNGVEFIIYARTNGEFTEQLNLRLAEISEQDAARIEGWLSKKQIHFESLESVSDHLKFIRENPLLVSAPDSEAARIFFQVFQLRPESAFGKLTLRLKELLPKTVESSGFARGSYEFWQKTYARELKDKELPDSWEPFLGSKARTEIAQFSFALETAYTIISRLILAKAADDHRFPHVRFMARIRDSLNELTVRDRLKPEHYLEVVRRSFDRASETLFSSIFSQDIFDWWFECSIPEARGLFYALAESTLASCQFNFEDLSGDFLGELYQHYFDRDTRKALGEFYTPPEAIEFILDECGYKGQRGHRLLDPACGSGSFLVAALRRYLSSQPPGSDPKGVLLDLTEGLRIVGFDINPFAVLMSQVNYAALILPLYAKTIYDDPDFRIVRLPVFRTDSLRIEEREGEWAQESADKLQVNLQFDEATLDVSVYLPIKGGKKDFVKMSVRVPRYGDARKQALVANLEEYIAALARLFQAVRDKRFTLDDLLAVRFAERSEKLRSYLEPARNALEETVSVLKGKYQDGRFLKTIEDLVLAVSLKNDLRYDFVVGNPPYVRIQKIPQHIKEYWAGKYEWTEHNYDLYVPFLERAVNSAGQEGWLGRQGRLGFILSDRFLNVDYGEKLRERLPESLRVDVLLDFRDTRVFAGALNYPAILIAERDGAARKGSLEAARVFTSEAGAQDVMSEFNVLRKKLDRNDSERSATVEVFKFPRQRLKGRGWWLMPPDEQQIFDKLTKDSAQKLIELTATSSGGFAGYQTSADAILVLDEAEDLGKTVKLWPRHEGNGCGCGKKPVEIEKDALRPFLFGRDVARWSIDWKRSWVLFPYDRYPKKESLEGDVVEEWNLIPSKANLDKFQFLRPEKIRLFEDRFPKAWKYLCKHEEKLRAREDHRYEQGKSEEHNWYGATYPRGLDYYFRPKLVLQLLSRRNSFAVDQEGKFVFQAGGKGGGVYGIAPASEVGNLRLLLAFLNSRLADFLMKQVSSVYGGRFYSYADQFLKGLPIIETILDENSTPARKLASLADQLTNNAAIRAELLRKTQMFPASFERDLSRYELNTIGHISTGHPTSAQLSLEPDAISVQSTLYGYEVQHGGPRTFQFGHREHAECLAAALRLQTRRSLTLKDTLEWRLPVKPEGCKKLLDLLARTQDESRRLVEQIASAEDELNEIVYQLYEISAAERSVIEGFLDRYSSYPAGSANGNEKDDDDVSGAAD